MDGIVVGVDRSAGARAALRWALHEGVLRGLPVTAVHAWGPSSASPLSFGLIEAPRSSRDRRDALEESLVEELLAQARAGGWAAGTEVRGVAVEGTPAAALAASAVGADQLVVGSRGAGGFSRLLLGSVSEHVVRHAPVTVTVVRRDHDTGGDGPAVAGPALEGPVVVGLDGSPSSRLALLRAAGEARARKVVLRAVHVRFPVQIHPGPSVSPFYDSPLKQIEHAARELLTAEIREVLGDASGLDLDAEVLVGDPAPALIDAAHGAQLLVLGSRGYGGFAGLMLGSVSSQCVHHAPCPVTVTR